MNKLKNKYNSSILIKNKNIDTQEIDYYFHLYLDSNSNIYQKFGNIRYVFCTGEREDADDLTLFFQSQLTNLKDIPKIVAKDDRFRIYVVSNCIIVSHELGASSLSILLQELTKVLSRVKCPFKGYVKFGRTWSFNQPLGTVITSNHCINQNLKTFKTVSILGKKQKRSIRFCSNVVSQFSSTCRNIKFGKITGVCNVLKSLGFSSTEIVRKDKEKKYLKNLDVLGVKQFDLESHIFGAFCSQLNIPCTVLGLVSGNLTKRKKFSLDPLFKVIKRR